MPLDRVHGLTPQELIRIKRDGGALSAAQIRDLVAGIVHGDVSESQVAAFTMAVFLRGMRADESMALTLAMRDSGTVCDWSDLGIAPATLIDKHSTGGVGDEKASLILVPLVAACGVHMPMISARGLGHTGGEIDLLDAIPGYDVAPPLERFRSAVARIGCGLIGQTPSLAPADGTIFRIRDVTATVESIPLITASILSKKLATGARGIVTSVNFGRGAFMSTEQEARALAQSMLDVATHAELPAVFRLCHMEDVVGDAIGSYPQLREVEAFLRGVRREPRLLEMVLALSAEVIAMAGLAATEEEARATATLRLNDGSAARKFCEMVEAFGGPAEFLGCMDTLLPEAPVVGTVAARADGFVRDVDARRIGLAMVALGAGRTLPGQQLDHRVGVSGVVHVGDAVESGAALCTLHAASESDFKRAADAIAEVITIGPEPVPRSPVFTERMANTR